jgi:hypothetical protein
MWVCVVCEIFLLVEIKNEIEFPEFSECIQDAPVGVMHEANRL